MLRRIVVTVVLVPALFLSGVATNQAATILPKSWTWTSDWRWVVPIAVATTLLAVVLQLAIESSRAQSKGHDVVRNSVRNVSPRGRPPRIEELTIEQFGAHRAHVPVKYIRRDKDAELVTWFKQADAVLVVGHSMAGKSRLSAEVLRREYPRRRILMPKTPNALTTLAAARAIPKASVVWLDELDQFLVEGGVSADVLDALKHVHCLVVGTMRTSAHDQLKHGVGVASAVLDRFHVVRMPMNDDDERRRLAAACDSSEMRDGVLRYGLGEYVGAGYLAVQKYENGLVEHPYGAALVRAAVDWRRTGMTSIPEGEIAELAKVYDTAKYASAEHEPISDALSWATQRIENTVWLLERDNGYLRPFDYVADYIENLADDIPRQIWKSVSEHCDDFEAIRVGWTAYTHNAIAVAERVWSRAAANGNTVASKNLGTLMYGRGNLQQAAALYREASKELPSAWSSLASVLDEMGDKQAAEHWYREAARIGDAAAELHLAHLLIESGTDNGAAEARVIWAKIAEAGDVSAAYNLALSMIHSGELSVARPWLSMAAQQGFAPAMYTFAWTLHMDGKLKSAASWYEKAIAASSDPVAVFAEANRGQDQILSPTARDALAEQLATVAHDASSNLGTIYMQLGKLQQAEKWYRRAVQTQQSPGSAYNLSLVLARQRKYPESEPWLLQAAKLGDPDAQRKWASLRYQAGDTAEAEKYFRAAAKSGDVTSIYNLSVVLRERSKPEFEIWARRAAKGGMPEAMSDLAIILQDRGQTEEAEDWWHRAAQLGHLDSMHNMAIITLKRGEQAESRRWRRRLRAAQIKSLLPL